MTDLTIPEPACTYADPSCPAYSKWQIEDFAAVARAAIERVTAERDQAVASQERSEAKYEAALKAGAGSPPTAEGIAAAIRQTEYKYFGDYELSDSQWEAVYLLVNAARCYLAAESKLAEARKALEDIRRRYGAGHPANKIASAALDLIAQQEKV